MQQTATLLFEELYPRSWRVQWENNINGIPDEFAPAPESHYMTASPYGEMTDVLSPRNLTLTVLEERCSVLL
jgi:hypothetical protein